MMFSEVEPLTTFPLLEFYTEASKAALVWQEDAFFIGAEWIPEGIEGYTPHITYEFISPRANAFFLVFANASGIETVEGDWPEYRPHGEPIDLEMLTLDSQEAMDKIVEIGGAGYVERNGTYGEHVFLRLTRLDEYSGSGPIVWVGGFSKTLPQAQLYITIDDLSGELVKVKAYGEQEQDIWLSELTEVKKLHIGDSGDFFDYFTLTLDAIEHSIGPDTANFTIESSEAKFLLRGYISHTKVTEFEPLYFGDYVVQISEIGESWVEFEVMPLIRWFISKPSDAFE